MAPGNDIGDINLNDLDDSGDAGVDGGAPPDEATDKPAEGEDKEAAPAPAKEEPPAEKAEPAKKKAGAARRRPPSSGPSGGAPARYSSSVNAFSPSLSSRSRCGEYVETSIRLCSASKRSKRR